MTYSSHNPYDEDHWVSRLRENFMSGSEGEGLETGNFAPRQSFTRQEDYKTIKCRLELENFSGKSALSVYQDFHAKVFAKNLVWMMAFPIKDSLNSDSETKKHRYQINFTQAFSKSKGVIALLFHDSFRKSKRLIVDLQYIFQRTVEPIRPGRKYPRKHKAKPRRYFLQYKPIG